MDMDAASGRATSLVGAFLEALRAGDPEAARPCLAKEYRDDPDGVPPAPFDIEDFEVEEVNPREEFLVAVTRIRGRESGEPVEQVLPFVLLEEEDGLHIHLEKTMSMLMSGEVGTTGAELVETAIESLADSLAEGADEFDAAAERSRLEHLEAALERFRPRVRTVHQDALRRATGLPELVLEVVEEGLGTDRDVGELGRLLSREIPEVFDYLPSSDRGEALSGVNRLVIQFSASAASWGPYREEDALHFVLPITSDSETFHAVISPRTLTLLSEPDLGGRFLHAQEQMGRLQDFLREEHGIEALCEVDWFRFTGSPDTGQNAWALYLLDLQGIQPLREGLSRLLAERGDLASAAKGGLRRISLSPAPAPDDRAIELEDDTLEFALHVAESHEDYWTADDLAARLSDALSRLSD